MGSLRNLTIWEYGIVHCKARNVIQEELESNMDGKTDLR